MSDLPERLAHYEETLQRYLRGEATSEEVAAADPLDDALKRMAQRHCAHQREKEEFGAMLTATEAKRRAEAAQERARQATADRHLPHALRIIDRAAQRGDNSVVIHSRHFRTDAVVDALVAALEARGFTAIEDEPDNIWRRTCIRVSWRDDK